MTGGAICGNTAVYSGGGVHNDGMFTMSGGAICGNTAGDNGGGVYNWSTFTMSGTASVTGNTAKIHGGGVYNFFGIFSMSDSASVTGNTAVNDGGGVYNDGGTFSMSGGASVTGNTSEENGGGVFNWGTFTMSGSASVTGNTAQSVGGGVDIYNGTFSMEGSASVTGNKKGDEDNNVCLYNGTKITIDGELTGNARIGVNMEPPGTFTDGLSGRGMAENFVSDNTTYAVRIVNGEAALGVPYTVTIASNGNGTVEANPTTAIAGETVTLNVQPDDGYALVSLTVKQGETDVTVTDNSFTMPAGDVTVSASFRTPLESDGDTYTINSAAGWDAFCELLANNNKGYFTGKTVKLGKSIEVTTMAGGSQHDFTGTFDGQNHTITVAYTSDEEYAAPFRNVENGCVIENLHVDGTITTSAQNAAGIIGNQFGTVLIHNCRSSVTIASSVDGDGTHGGLVAVKGNSNSAKLTIEGCVFDGKIISTDLTKPTIKCGGFVGWRKDDGTLTIKNSLYAPADDDSAVTNGATFSRNGGTITNCYYTKPLGDEQGKAAHTVSAGEGVTLDLGEGTAYGVSGITAYAHGMRYGGAYYAGEGETVSLSYTGTPPTGYTFTGFTASAGTLDGNTLTMPAGDVTVSAAFIYDEWAALQSAINDADVGATIDLSNFADTDGRITCPADGDPLNINKEITLDLHGCVLDRGLTSAVPNGYVICITWDGDLTVEDSSPDVENTYTDPITGEPVTVYGGVITGGNNDGKFTMSGGAICGNTAGIGGGVYNWGTFSMSDSASVTGNTAEADGGGVENYGMFTMEGSASVTDNTAGQNGGGVDNYEGKFTMSGGASVTGNTAEYDGGGVENWGTFSMSGGASVTGNTAQSDGGGVFNYRNFTMSGGASVTGNKVGEADNNVCLHDDKKITIDGELTGDAPIGVTMRTPGTFTDGLSNNGTAANFMSDDEAYRVRVNDGDGEAALYSDFASYHVWIADSENGTVTADRGTDGGLLAAEGDTVTLNVQPNDGYALDTLTVTDGNGDPVTVTDSRFTMPGSDVYVSATWQDTTGFAKLCAAAFVFEGTIKVKFYYVLPDALTDGALVFTRGGSVAKSIAISEGAAEADGRTSFIFESPIPQYSEAVNVRLLGADGEPFPTIKASNSENITRTGYTFSMEGLANRQADTANTAEMRALAHALADYGTAARNHFVEDGALTDDICGDVKAVTAAQMGGGVTKTGNLPEGVLSSSVTASFNADNRLTVYFTFDEGVNPGSFIYKVDDEERYITKSGNKYYLRIDNIPAKLLGETHTFTVSTREDPDAAYTINASVIAYARSVVDAPAATESMKLLSKAVYLYWKAADAYFPNDN